MRKYDLLLFDADGTLFDFRRAMFASIKRCLASFDEGCDSAMLSAYDKVNSDMWRGYQSGAITRKDMQKERFVRFFSQFNLKIDPLKFDELYLEALGDCPFLLDDAEETVIKLSKNYRMAIITNGIAPMQRIRISKSTIYPYFENVFISAEMGVSKPQKEYFDRVLASFPEIKKERILVVGDTAEVDIKGANIAGLDSCFINPAKVKLPPGIHSEFQIQNIKDLLNII